MLTVDEQQYIYNHIMSLYDKAERIIDAIEQPQVKNAEEQVRIAEPFIYQAQDTIEEIAQGFINYIDNGQRATPEMRKKMETSIRKFYVEIGKVAEALSQIKVPSKA